MQIMRLVPVLGVVLALLIPTALRAQTPLICTTSAGVPPLIRAEGGAELLGDVLLVCTGSQAGRPVGPYDITLIVGNAAITSRIVGPAQSLSEALLLIDELTGGALPGTNLYQGTVSGNTVTFSGIRFTDPGPSANRIIRITNVRARVDLLHPRTGQPGGWYDLGAVTVK